MFELNEKDIKEFNEWKKEHDKTCELAKPGATGAIGGGLTYCFTPTGLGVITVIKCGCGEELNLTHSEDW